MLWINIVNVKVICVTLCHLVVIECLWLSFNIHGHFFLFWELFSVSVIILHDCGCFVSLFVWYLTDRVVYFNAIHENNMYIMYIVVWYNALKVYSSLDFVYVIDKGFPV